MILPTEAKLPWQEQQRKVESAAAASHLSLAKTLMKSDKNSWATLDPCPALMEWRRDGSGGANKHQCSRVNTPPSVVPTRLSWMKCSSGCRYPSIRCPAAHVGHQPKSTPPSFTTTHFIVSCSPLHPPPHTPPHTYRLFLSYAAIILSCKGVRVKAVWCVCVDSGGGGLHVSRRLTGAGQHGQPCSLQCLWSGDVEA